MPALSHHAPRRREDAAGRRLGGRPTRCEPAGRERIARNGAARSDADYTS